MIFEIREFNSCESVLRAPVAPLVAIICGSCGYKVSFNALKFGVIEQPAGTPSKEADNDG